MRRDWSYKFFLLLPLMALLLFSCNQDTPRKFNERMTFKHRDFIPYGSEVAKRLLPQVFPEADIYYDRNYPGFWDSIRTTSYNQAVILMSKDFEASRYELERLVDFAENGNYVFIIAKTFSGDTRRMFRFSFFSDDFGFQQGPDSMWMRLDKSIYFPGEDFVFPGRDYESWFTNIDTTFTQVLGRDRNNRPNFIAFRRGSGVIFIHSSPMAFSNYFILHKSNYRYYEKALSAIPSNVSDVLWNDYYLEKKQPENKRHWLSVLFQYESFKWGLITAICALVLYVLLASRRKQNMIPLHTRPKNDSLDFVKTMGRLYHERKDHQDLARKMAVYFLEHIRTVYKLPTHTLDDSFLQALHFKSGYPVEELRSIVSFIQQLELTTHISELQLSDFYRKLESFYQNT
jgi:hypothetical protein